VPADVARLCDDLLVETAELDGPLASLDEAAWATPTPAEGWTVRDQVSHLAHFDEAAVLSATDPDRFRAERVEAGDDVDGFTTRIADRHRSMPGDELLAWFRRSRATLVDVFGALDPSARVPWYGPDMSVAAAVTARIMETWAHGQDVADGLGAARRPTAALRHVAHIGVRALPNSFVTRGRPVPDEPVFVELVAPSGETWTWNDPAAADSVRGPAIDFCLVATRRRHLHDTALAVLGPVASEWMAIAQAYAGPAGAGRSAGQFAPEAP
jgi:uncharacterized protein (TIGR03084 family)